MGRGSADSRQQPDHALIEHWDGRRWSAVRAPEQGSASTQLLAVTATGDDIRAVGDAQDGVHSVRTFAEGSEQGRFSVQSTANPSTGDNRLTGVVAVDDDDTWAVGGVLDTASGNVNTLILRGGEHSPWANVVSPNPSADGSSQLSSVTLVESDLWAVGGFDGPDAAQTLVLHRSK